MRAAIVNIALCFQFLSVAAQYEYFNEVYPGWSPWGEIHTNLIVKDSTYISFGIKGGNLGDTLRFSVINSFGERISKHDSLMLNTSVYIQTAESLTPLANGKYLWGGTVGTADENYGAVVMFDSLFQITNWYSVIHESADTSYVNMDGAILLNDGNIACSGKLTIDTIVSELSSDFVHGIFVIKLDTLGNKIWETFSHASDTMAFFGYRIIQLPDDDLLVTGYYGPDWVDEPGNYNPILLKYDNETGEFLGEYQWGSPFPEGPPAVVLNEDGALFVSSFVTLEMPEFGNNTYRIVEPQSFFFDPGIMLPISETFNYGLLPFDELMKVAACKDACKTEDGGMAILLGWSDEYYYSHGGILKMNQFGEAEWFHEYTCVDTICHINVQDIEAALDGGLIVTGYCLLEPNNAQRHWMLKVDACGDEEDFGCSYPYVEIAEVEQKESSLLVYPNPANSVVSLKNLPPTTSRILFIDMLGSVVLEQYISRGKTQTEIDILNLASGCYNIVVEMESGQNAQLELLIKQ